MRAVAGEIEEAAIGFPRRGAEHIRWQTGGLSGYDASDRKANSEDQDLDSERHLRQVWGGESSRISPTAARRTHPDFDVAVSTKFLSPSRSDFAVSETLGKGDGG